MFVIEKKKEETSNLMWTVQLLKEEAWKRGKYVKVLVWGWGEGVDE